MGFLKDSLRDLKLAKRKVLRMDSLKAPKKATGKADLRVQTKAS